MAAASNRGIGRITPVLRCEDADRSLRWYRQLGFELHSTHQLEAGMPVFMVLAIGELWLFLSEHTGDARPGGTAYLHVEDIDDIAAALGARARDKPWGMREFELCDPDGNVIRFGAPIARAG